MLSDTVAAGVIGQFYGKAQRTIIENLIFLIAPRKHQLSVLHQCGSTATQTRSYAIAVKTVTVVMMERGGHIDLVGFLGLADSFQ